MMSLQKTLLFLFFSFGVGVLHAQLDIQFTQFYYNRLNYNPAFAGSTGNMNLVFAHRSQWLGLEGAPTSQLVSFDKSVAQGRVGLGAQIMRSTIGVESRMDLSTHYSYMMPLGTGTLSFGLGISLKNYGIDYGDQRLQGTQPINVDAAISGTRESKWLPNAGVGVYYHSRSLFIGLSSPQVLENNIDFDSDVSVESRQLRHVYFMSGLAFDLGLFTIQPMTLMKLTANSPFNADVSLMLTYQDRFTFGSTFRVSSGFSGSNAESIALLAAVKMNSGWQLGLSYDLTLSNLRAYQNGSIEFLVRYTKTDKEDAEVINPRFF